MVDNNAHPPYIDDKGTRWEWYNDRVGYVPTPLIGEYTGKQGRVTTPPPGATPTTPSGANVKDDKDILGKLLGDIAPFPANPPPPGYYWEYDPTMNQWYPAATSTTGAGRPTEPKKEIDEFGNVWEVEQDPITGGIFRRKVEAAPKKEVPSIPTGAYATPGEAETARQTTGNPDWYQIDTDVGAGGVYYVLTPTKSYGRQKKEKDYNYIGPTYTDTRGKGWRWDDYEGYVRDTTLDDEGSFESDDERRAREEREKERQYRAAQDAADRERIRQQEEEDKRRWEREQQQRAEDTIRQQREWQQTYGLQTKQFEAQQSQFAAQQSMERERLLAEKRANPQSWLEYAQLAGQTPAVQPWMKPLMPQQYQGIQAGQAIPGYSPTGTSMNLPELTTPSTQYTARIAPSAYGQYQGYERARTGQTPQDIDWRLWNMAPPAGRNPELTYQK